MYIYNYKKLYMDSLLMTIGLLTFSIGLVLCFKTRTKKEVEPIKIFKHYETSTGKTYLKYVIPVGNFSFKNKDIILSKLISNYQNDVEFDTESGILEINDKISIPFQKEIWFPMENELNDLETNVLPEEHKDSVLVYQR